MTHRFELRIYYEDTDLAGIVYYANYLKFIERARTEFIRTLGIDQTEVKRALGVVFAVRQLKADYLATAKFDDVLTVKTSLAALSGARISLHQDVLRQGHVLFSARVTLVCLTDSGRATRIPADIRLKLNAIT